jgi:acetate kinase
MLVLVIDAALACARATLVRVDGDGASALWQGAPTDDPPGTPQRVVHRFIHAPRGGGETAAEANVDTLLAAGVYEPRDTLARLAALETSEERWPALPRTLVFDTPFFRDLPAEARCYAIPQDLAAELDLFRRGRHGPVHRLGVRPGRCVSIVLAGETSVAALVDGAPVEVSCGVSALEGVPGETTCGDIDPAGVLYLVDNLGLTPEEAERALSLDGGLRGAADPADPDSGPRLLIHRLRRYVGAYAALLDGLDALVIAGGDEPLAARLAAGLGYLGVGARVPVSHSPWTPATAAAWVATQGRS